MNVERDTSEVIAACPFCGADDAHVIGITATGESSVICYTCGGETAHKATAAEAIAAWNRRPDAFHEAPAECDACGGLVACPRCDAEPADAGRDAYPFGQSEYPEQVIRLLIAGGYVSQAKVDEARAIALNLQPEPLSPPSEAATAVDDAMVERAVEAFLANTGQAHTVTQLQRDLTTGCMRAALTAALSSQQSVKP